MKAVHFVEDVRDKLVPIDQVRQHPDNPNNGDDENLIESIQINGFYTTITADRATGYILAGNTRYRALHALGAKEIPVVWLDKDRDGTLRVLVGDNASARRAIMDQGALLEILGELAESQRGLVGTSITSNDYEKMLLEFAAGPEDMEIAGFGKPGIALHGIFQVVIEFPENEAERDAVYAELAERFENVRMVNL